jgi:protein-disulfide isomerase
MTSTKTFTRLRYLLVTIAALAASIPAFAADFTPEQRTEIIQIVRDALKNDPSILRDAIEAFQSDQARAHVEASKAAIAAQHDAIYDKADPAVGSGKPSVTIVEFFDPRCPYCRGLEAAMSKWLPQAPDVRLVYKDLPILGPSSVLGSRALLAAQRQDGYARLRDAIMAGPPNVTEDSIRDAVKRLGLDWPKLQQDMRDPAIQQRIDGNVRLAKTLGIEGTPAFVMGDRLIEGADLSDVQAAVSGARPSR